jgi:glycosyltransferase involved in cell wall biosynthesis
MRRVAFLFSHPIQYFAPLMRQLAARPEIELTAYFCSRMGVEEVLDPGFGQTFKWDIPLLEGYRSHFLPAVQRDQTVRGWLNPFNPALVPELVRSRYDVLVVHGYASATNWLAFLAARLAGTAVLFRGEVRLRSDQHAGWSAVKSLGLRTMFRVLVDGCLYIGARSHEFYAHYGVPAHRLFFTPYCVDNDFFQTWAAQLAPKRADLRAELGITDDRPVILFVGKLVPKKQPLMLLQAYAMMRCDHRCALVYVGDGELRGALESRVREQNLPDVKITGFLNQTEIPRVYAAADVLVLPSLATETWGLVFSRFGRAWTQRLHRALE